MSRLDEVHGLLSTLLNTFSTARSIDVKWEGVVEDPSSSTYLREWFLPGEFTGHHLGPTAPNAGPIIYQVDVVTAIGQWGVAYGISKLFFGSSYFKRGQSLVNSANTTRVIIRAGQVGPGIRDGSKYILPMSVMARVHMTI